MCQTEIFFAARGLDADGKTANFERFWYFSRHRLAVNGSNRLKMVEKDKTQRILIDNDEKIRHGVPQASK